MRYTYIIHRGTRGRTQTHRDTLTHRVTHARTHARVHTYIIWLGAWIGLYERVYLDYTEGRWVLTCGMKFVDTEANGGRMVCCASRSIQASSSLFVSGHLAIEVACPPLSPYRPFFLRIVGSTLLHRRAGPLLLGGLQASKQIDVKTDSGQQCICHRGVASAIHGVASAITALLVPSRRC